MPKRSILVFGATGALGGHLLEALADRGLPRGSVTAAGRNKERLTALDAAGFQTAVVDMSDAARVAELVTLHDEVVLISGGDPDRASQHQTVIDAARAANTAHVYYTSGVRADDDQFPINADHFATERALATSGVTHTILRNTWYVENFLQSLGGPRHTGVLTAAAGGAVVAAATRKDLAEALAVVVTTEGHEGRTYSLSGDVDYSYDDIAEAMSEVLGREVVYRPVSPGIMRDLLQSNGLAADAAAFIVGLDETIAAGAFARVGDDLRRLLGRPTTGLAEGLRSA